MMGFKDNDGNNVPAEINKLTVPVTIIYGSDEHDISEKELTGKKVRIIKLPGGHHYDGNTTEVAATITNALTRS
jgi:type IV secretory pathway VirJ component